MDTLLTPAQAADFLGVSTNTLACWRSTRRYPLAYVRVGSRVRYRESDIERFLRTRAENQAENTSA
jgi:excisionase family DNA binding protein